MRYGLFPVSVNVRDHVVDVAFGDASVASAFVSPVCHVTPSAASHRFVLRSWISTWTRRTPVVAVAVPVMLNGTPLCTTRPANGVVMVVSIGPGAGMLL